MEDKERYDLYKQTHKTFRRMRHKVEGIIKYDGWSISYGRWVQIAEIIFGPDDPEVIAYHKAMAAEIKTRGSND